MHPQPDPAFVWRHGGPVRPEIAAAVDRFLERARNDAERAEVLRQLVFERFGDPRELVRERFARWN